MTRPSIPVVRKGLEMGKSIKTGRGVAAGAGGEGMGSAPEGTVFLGGVMKCGIGWCLWFLKCGEAETHRDSCTSKW